MQTSSADNYLVHREKFRRRAFEAFHATDPNAAELVAATGEIVAASTLFLSGRDLSATKERLYTGDLIVSFCRTHFVAVDLVQQSELVEAATLIRKQIELMARIRELSAFASLDKLLGKVPNVRHLSDQLRRQYAEYSEVAHSATPVVMRLMGRLERDGKIHTPIYPEFDTDAYVALNHVAWLCIELYACTGSLYPDWFPDQVLPDLKEQFDVLARFVTTPQVRR